MEILFKSGKKKSKGSVKVNGYTFRGNNTTIFVFASLHNRGWLGGAMVLGKLPGPGRPQC